MPEVAKRFCHYCRVPKPEGTKFFIVRDRNGRKVNSKCDDCRKRASRTVAERDARGKAVTASKKAEQGRFLQNLNEIYKKDQLSKKREEKD